MIDSTNMRVYFPVRFVCVFALVRSVSTVDSCTKNDKESCQPEGEDDNNSINKYKAGKHCDYVPWRINQLTQFN